MCYFITKIRWYSGFRIILQIFKIYLLYFQVLFTFILSEIYCLSDDIFVSELFDFAEFFIFIPENEKKNIAKISII